MKPGNLTTALCRSVMRAHKLTALAILFFASLFVFNTNFARGQQKADHSKKDTATPVAEDAAADNDYSKKIKEYTTEPYFMTELVDHLPMSDKIPSPDKVLGYVVGTPNKLTYSKDLYRY